MVESLWFSIMFHTFLLYSCMQTLQRFQRGSGKIAFKLNLLPFLWLYVAYFASCQISVLQWLRWYKCKIEVKKNHGSWVLVIDMQTLKLHMLLFCNDGTEALLLLCIVLLPFRPPWLPNQSHPKALPINLECFIFCCG